MPRRLRILTFGRRPLYLSRLARTGHQFDVVPAAGRALAPWSVEGHLAPNARVMDEAAARHAARRGRYDLAVCHSLQDLRFASDLGLTSATVFHTPFELEAAFGLSSFALEKAAPLLESTRVVFASAFVGDTWHVPGIVIEPGLDCAEAPEYDGGRERLLVVASLVRELPWLSGCREIEAVAAGFPVTLYGFNPSVAGCRPLERQSEVREARRSHRAYLAVAPAPWHDPLDPQLLEAMAAGMPVVAAGHYAPAVTNGVTGFVAADRRALRAAVLELFGDRALAARMGAAGRAAVAERFPIARFAERWNELFQEMLAAGRGTTVHS